MSSGLSVGENRLDLLNLHIEFAYRSCRSLCKLHIEGQETSLLCGRRHLG
jgi:hypothetical protein